MQASGRDEKVSTLILLVKGRTVQGGLAVIKTFQRLIKKKKKTFKRKDSRRFWP